MDNHTRDNWAENCLLAIRNGRSGSVCIESLLKNGAFMLFRNDGGSLNLVYRKGYENSNFRYLFLEENPGLLGPVVDQGFSILPGVDASEPERKVFGFVDSLQSPGYLMVLETSDPSVVNEGSLLRVALLLSESEHQVVRSVRTLDSMESVFSSLPVWLHDTCRKLVQISEPILLISEPGSGADELVRATVKGRGIPEEAAVFFSPERLSPPVQLREIFGDPAGARLGGSGAGIPLVEKSGGAVIVLEPASLELQVQDRLVDYLKDDPGQSWIFISTLDLQSLTEAGKFSRALFLILEEHRTILPPLRARLDRIQEEVIRLLKNFRDRYRRNVELDPGAITLLQDYDWPGNWRELKDILESAFLMNGTGLIQSDDLRIGSWSSPESAGDELNLRKRSAELEKELLLQAYALHGGNQVHMARALGISRGSLQYKMEKYGIT